MKTSIALALAAAVAALLAATAGASTKTTKLLASVSDPFKISLTTASGGKVATLKAGTYSIVVKDTAADHNFHLTGPGVNKLTSISGKTTTTWKVVLKKGTYKYVCDPHSSFMKGSFTVK